jgi:hypothetical protein
MDLKDKKRDNSEDHHSVQGSEGSFIHKQTEKLGWFRKLLNWISKGAAESNMDTRGCPT